MSRSVGNGFDFGSYAHCAQRHSLFTARFPHTVVSAKRCFRQRQIPVRCALTDPSSQGKLDGPQQTNGAPTYTSRLRSNAAYQRLKARQVPGPANGKRADLQAIDRQEPAIVSVLYCFLFGNQVNLCHQVHLLRLSSKQMTELHHPFQTLSSSSKPEQERNSQQLCLQEQPQSPSPCPSRSHRPQAGISLFHSVHRHQAHHHVPHCSQSQLGSKFPPCLPSFRSPRSKALMHWQRLGQPCPDILTLQSQPNSQTRPQHKSASG